MYQVQEYADLAIEINGRLFASYQVPLPLAVVPPVGVAAAVGRSAYLGRIARAIDYGRMRPWAEGAFEPERWYASKSDESSIGCAWFQEYGDRVYGIAMLLKSLPDGVEYQNPPRDVDRLLFAYVDLAHPYGAVVESIPDIVADRSLAALPYVAMPVWGWAVLGAVGIVGAVALIKAAR